MLAHSDRLDEVSHGAATGSVRDRSLAELREVAPELPTLDEALAFFVDEAPGIGLHVDLKLTTRLDELAVGAPALRSRAADGRLVLPRAEPARLRAVTRPTVRIGFTYPEDRYGVSRRPAPRSRCCAPDSSGSGRRCRPFSRGMIRRAGATALMLQHALVTPRCRRAARARSEPRCSPGRSTTRTTSERVVEAGVAGVITNDPRIFAAIRT